MGKEEIDWKMINESVVKALHVAKSFAETKLMLHEIEQRQNNIHPHPTFCNQIKQEGKLTPIAQEAVRIARMEEAIMAAQKIIQLWLDGKYAHTVDSNVIWELEMVLMSKKLQEAMK